MAQNSENVFDFLQNRILTHYPEAVQIRNREMPAPRMAIVYPTYICNQDCTWCEYAESNNEHHNMMKDEDLLHLVAQLHDLDVKSVEFCGGGEPSLHPKLPEAIRDLHKHGMSVGILTNGTKLYGELADVLIDYASYVRVGFDGASKEIFHKVKRPRSPEAGYDAVCQNVKNAVAMRNERGTKCRISMKVVVDSENCHEVEQCAELAMELGVDSVQFKAARVCSTELNDENTQEVNEAIASSREKYAGKLAVVGNVTKVNTTTQCWLTPLQLTVDALGEVFLCCYYSHRTESHTIGNCFAEPLRDLWYDEHHWDRIDAIKPHECNNLDCRFVRYNEIMNAVMVEDDAQFEFI